MFAGNSSLGWATSILRMQWSGQCSSGQLVISNSWIEPLGARIKKMMSWSSSWAGNQFCVSCLSMTSYHWAGLMHNLSPSSALTSSAGLRRSSQYSWRSVRSQGGPLWPRKNLGKRSSVSRVGICKCFGFNLKPCVGGTMNCFSNARSSDDMANLSWPKPKQRIGLKDWVLYTIFYRFYQL